MSTRVRIQEDFVSQDIQLMAMHYAGRRDSYAMRITFEPIGEHDAMKPEHYQRPLNGPPLRELVQSIMDEAWANGFRPSGYGDVKEATAAVKEHLKDMRAVAFHKLGIAS
jgi:hypothetical protein